MIPARTLPNLTACALLAMLAPGAAWADIFRYVDADGVTHFTNVPNDSRYKLYIATQKEPAPVTVAFDQAPPPRAPVRVDKSRIASHIHAAARTYGVEVALIQAVIAAESGYNPLAISPKGARGLMQLMPDTARRYRVQNPWDAEQNINGGTAYLRDLLNMFGDKRLALAAYNAGEGSVIRHGNSVPQFPETVQYVPRVLSYYRYYRAQL